MKIRLHIDRLVLEGVPIDRLQGAALQESMTAELEQLIREHGLHPEMKHAGAHARIPGGKLTISRPPRTAPLGRNIARSVFDAIGAAPQSKRRDGA